MTAATSSSEGNQGAAAGAGNPVLAGGSAPKGKGT